MEVWARILRAQELLRVDYCRRYSARHFHGYMAPYNRPRQWWRAFFVPGEKIISGEIYALNFALNYVENPGVYLWYRGRTCLYVGLTRVNLAVRLSDPRHPINGYTEGLVAGDVMIFLECGGFVVRDFERLLIEHLHPIFNRQR